MCNKQSNVLIHFHIQSSDWCCVAITLLCAIIHMQLVTLLSLHLYAVDFCSVSSDDISYLSFLFQDGERKGTIIKKIPKAKPTEPTQSDSPLNKKPLILSKTCTKLQSSTTNTSAVEHTDVVVELPVLSDPSFSCYTNQSEVETPAHEVPGDDGMPIASCLALSPCSERHSEELADSTVTVLCCESLGPFSNGEANVDAAALQAALGQAFSFVPVEIVKDQPLGEGEHISVYEHSYCRPDTDKDQLWSKILSLHTKILELDRREESTVAKIHALETEIALLKRDGAAFKEKQKVLEDYISSMLL